VERKDNLHKSRLLSKLELKISPNLICALSQVNTTQLCFGDNIRLSG